MRLPSDLSVLIYYGISIFALNLYIYGFFPLEELFKPQSTKYERSNKDTNRERERHVQKLVFFVIDALRYDFIISEDENYMPFLVSSIQENNACLLKTLAQAPTVTMPRIKAITSGTVPSFFDVILNFQTSSFTLDNFITQAHNHGQRLVFYGDDTWLKLFPNQFIRHEGVTSFFASDYTEVDNNVTKNVLEELKKDDWDVMILHYLGLDHIGHMENPKSLLVKPKLMEMDQIIKKISDYLKKLEYEQNISTMLFVTGDHGMKDSGSHGGVTYPEITVPFVSVGQGCNDLPGWPNDTVIPQIDIASTVSILLGLPIPKNNIGKLIPQILNPLTQQQILIGLENIRNKLSHDKNFNLIRNFKKSLEKLAKEYHTQLNKLSELESKLKTEFKLPFLFIGCFLFFISSLFFSFKLYDSLRPKKISHWILVLGTIVHTLSFCSTSFIEEEHQTWYFFWITFCLTILLESLNFDFDNLKKWGYVKSAVSWFVICFAHRILRKLNQTGDKWASLPDLEGYLSDRRTLLLVLFLAGILGMFYWCCHESCGAAHIFTYAITLLTIFAYRLAIKNVDVDFFSYPTTRGSIEVKLFWAFLAMFIVQTMYYRTSIYLIWSLIAGLLLRPHNVILVPTEIFISYQIHKIYNKPQDVLWNTIAHVWLGYVFYFYQGNGNSIANIDVASGFIGLEDYEPTNSFFMMEAHTCSAMILSFLLSPKSSLIYGGLRIIPLTLFCTILVFQLHHLFIWSVFSPKLLYETNLTLIIFICLLMSCIFKKRIFCDNEICV